jgi:hypothetical protein
MAVQKFKVVTKDTTDLLIYCTNLIQQIFVGGFSGMNEITKILFQTPSIMDCRH